MTDPHHDLPTDPLDALASAHLDGLSTEAEAARIAGDPDLTARVRAMAAARTALRADDAPVDDARREAAITAALAAFDAAYDLPDEASGGAAPATPITVAASRRPMSRRTLRLVTAAAVAVLLALAVPLLGRLDSGGSDGDLATSSLDDADSETAPRDAAADDMASEGDDAQAPAAPESFSAVNEQSFDLGAFEDLASLEDAVRPLLSSERAPAPAASTTAADRGAGEDAAGEGSNCADAPDATRSGPRVLTGTATVDARSVVVFVYEGPDGEHELVVLDANDCSVLTTGTIS
jgi:hypothetical protein